MENKNKEIIDAQVSGGKGYGPKGKRGQIDKYGKSRSAYDDAQRKKRQKQQKNVALAEKEASSIDDFRRMMDPPEPPETFTT